MAGPDVLIIGGTAAYGLDLSPWRPAGPPIILQTPYGPSPPITLLQPDPGQTPVAFCSRHGREALKRSAAFLNHRAIIWAAKMLGVGVIFSWNGVGAIDQRLEVGELVVPADLIDFTRTRVTTFDHPDLRPASGPAFHPAARTAILASLPTPNPNPVPNPVPNPNPIPIPVPNSTYVCTEGPRLETEAEIELYRRAGAHVVGMTLSPEIFLAQEAGIMYASLCYITNYATGRALGRPPRREFGPVVARTCLPILLHAATLIAH
jgi:5'-methylthioadenosine phosphorylase